MLVVVILFHHHQTIIYILINSLLQANQNFLMFLFVFCNRHYFRLKVCKSIEPVSTLHGLVLMQTASKGIQKVFIEPVLIYLAFFECYWWFYYFLLQLFKIYILEKLRVKN